MVQVKLIAREPSPAVLTGAVIPGIDVVPAETDLTFRDAIIAHQEYDSRNPDDPIDQSDGLILYRDGEITPAIEIKRLILVVHCPCNPLIKEGKSTPD